MHAHIPVQFNVTRMDLAVFLSAYKQNSIQADSVTIYTVMKHEKSEFV
jgi:hypothetical protein